MLLAGSRLDDVTEGTLQCLVGEAEGRCLDFKRDQYRAGDSGKKEFAADISSFANTMGGHLIIGMDDRAGIASELVGAEFAPNADAELLRLEQAARSGIQPRIAGLRFMRVPLASGKEALVVEIPVSFTKPHRVVAGGSNHFFARGSAGKYEPDVTELRDLFEQGPALAGMVRDFRLDRTAQVRAGQTPVVLPDYRSAYVLHIVPLASFNSTVDLEMSQLRRHAEDFHPLHALPRDGWRAVPTLEGLTVYDDAYREAYTSVWRTGQVEAVIAPLVRPINDRIPAYVSADGIRNCSVNGLNKYLSALHVLGVMGPYAVTISLHGVAGAWLDFAGGGHHFRRDAVYAREVVMDDVFDFADPEIKDCILACISPCLHDIANAAEAWTWTNLH